MDRTIILDSDVKKSIYGEEDITSGEAREGQSAGGQRVQSLSEAMGGANKPAHLAHLDVTAGVMDEDDEREPRKRLNLDGDGPEFSMLV